VFCGSYHTDDVQILLTPLGGVPFKDIAEKERLIQSGQSHYSEMISREALPSPQYMSLFQDAMVENADRMASDCLTLARMITTSIAGNVALVSLARAGTPIGVIVKNLIQELGRGCQHYSISIIRDRGIDAVALDYIRERHPDRNIVFLDGWTGKGVITRELTKSIRDYNATRSSQVSDHLYVLSDLCGVAHCAATCEDYLIPSSILNATVSGLVSRSILNNQVGAGQFHGCVYYEEFAAADISRPFAIDITQRAIEIMDSSVATAPADLSGIRIERRQVSERFLADYCLRYRISDVNLIKPGIGEATRVLLRRVPERLILKDRSLGEVAHLRRLAAEKRVPIEADSNLPYKAVSLIRSALDG
jgi:hypothetical protein